MDNKDIREKLVRKPAAADTGYRYIKVLVPNKFYKKLKMEAADSETTLSGLVENILKHHFDD